MISTALSALSVLSMILVFIFTLKKPNLTLYLMTGISLLTTSLIVGGSYPAFDEILVFGVALALFVNQIKVTVQQNTKVTGIFNKKAEIVFILFLLLNSLFHSAIDFEISNLRFVLLFGCLLLVVVFSAQIPQETRTLSVITLFCIKANLYAWVLYWILLKFLGVDWATEQAKTWAGTSYAALVPAVGLLLLFLIENENSRKIPSRSYHLYFFVSVVASVLYDSRVMSFAVYIVAFYLVFRIRSIRATVLLFVVLVIGQFIGNILVGNSPFEANPFGKFNSLSESIQFINNPRVSDLDRSQQINCSFSLVVQKSSWENMIFGYGQNAHKHVMRKCLLPENDVSVEKKLIRPVGFAAFIVDFGLLGLLLLMILVTKTILNALKSDFGVLKSLLILWILSWSFLTNNLDHLFVYLVLLFNFFANLKAKSNLLKIED